MLSRDHVLLIAHINLMSLTYDCFKVRLLVVRECNSCVNIEREVDSAELPSIAVEPLLGLK